MKAAAGNAKEQQEKKTQRKLKRKEKKAQRKLNSDRQKESDMQSDMGEKIQFGELEFSTITNTENPGVTITESLERIFECTAQADEYDYSRLKPTPLSCENGGVNTGEKKPLVGYMLFCKHNREAAKKMLPSGVESKGMMPAIALFSARCGASKTTATRRRGQRAKSPKESALPLKRAHSLMLLHAHLLFTRVTSRKSTRIPHLKQIYDWIERTLAVLEVSQITIDIFC